MFQKLVEFSIKNRVIVFLAVSILVVLGVNALHNLPTEFLPDLSSPIVSVITERPGLAPSEVENLITRPIENSLQSLPDVENIRSKSTSGLSLVTVTFKWGTDYYWARQFISQNLAEVITKLPVGTRAPFLSNAASRLGEVIEYYLKSDSLSLMDLRELANYDVRLKLKSVPGVARVANMGGEVRQYQILVNQDKLRYYQIGLDEIAAALKNNNVNFSGGVITEGPVEFTVRGLGRLYRLNDLYQVIVTTRNGFPVYLKDLATIREAPQFRRGIIYVNGKEAVRGVVTKQYGSDTQPVINGLLKAINEIKPYLPKSVELRPFFNQAELILVSVHNLKDALLIGGFAVLLIVLLFLSNFRSALIIGITLPISVFITFIFMHLFHVTINVMSLGGIAVGLGIMIDAAIVVTENIFRWLNNHPGEKYLATLKGAVEMLNPVKYSTAIIIVVFVPLMFLPGFEGKLFKPFAFTIIISMLVGLALSVTLTPLLCYSFLSSKPGKSKESWLTRAFYRIYDPLIKVSLKRPVRAMLFVLLMLVLSAGMIAFMGTELLPPFDENAFMVKIYLPPGTSLDESARVSNQILSIASQAPDVRNIVAAVGRSEGGEETEGMSNFSENYVELVPRDQRTKSIEEIEDWIREKIAGFPGAIVTFDTPLNDRIEESISGSRGQLAVKIFGPDYDILMAKAAALKNIMQNIPGVTDLFMNQSAGLPFINILIDRKAAGRYGLTPENIADDVETALEGKTATTILQGVKEFAVFVRLQKQFRNSPEKVASILISTPNEKTIKLSQVAKIWQDSGPMLIERENLQRRVQLTCNISGGDINHIVSTIKNRIPQLHLPIGYSVSFGGNYARQQELNHLMIRIVLILLLVVFMLLLLAFHSIWQAVLIILTIPLALMGGVWALFFTVTTFNVSSLIGFVAHFGLTVQKGVILMEYINDLRQQGMPIKEAVILAGRTRMRPVLMTATAASLAVLPLALGIGAGAEIQQPMAIVLIGGLLVSTPMVLVILPVLYAQVEKFRKQDTD
ncbi:MAG: efflux RND transporter permease subunit [Calditrichaeota bacterium]|nr:efflux RND transporter permease subunit [Calditrichota bacterium]